MPQIFGCPHCQQSFQVPDDSAGQSFECPSCSHAVEVPAQPQQPVVFGCPDCKQGFGVTREMEGEQLACPHCSAMVMVSFSDVVKDSPADETPDFEEVSVAADEGATVAEDEEPPVAAGQNEPESESESPDGDSTEAKAGFFSRFKRKQAPVEALQEQSNQESDDSSEEETQPPDEPEEEVFEPKPVDHLLPPKFGIPDPVRFPTRKDGTVLLPDGKGGYSSADPNTVTITHKGEVIHLKRMTPQQRQRRKIIHNTIAIVIAVGLIWLTLDALGIDLLK